MAKKVEEFFSVSFAFEKETPGTYRFMETGEKEKHRIGTLYVKKAVYPNGPPKGLNVVVEVAK